MQTDVFRIGTRGSGLALAQAIETRERLMRAHDLPQEAFSLEVITTTGDRITDRSLSEIGGKGLFTREIEDALLNGKIDIAVHSAKDMPTALPDELILSAFLPRQDPRDAFIAASCACLDDLSAGAVVGTSSLRRQALVLRARPDLKVVTFRGNVSTRLQKLGNGDVDATLLANAGLLRLGMEEVISDLLPLSDFPPALGQGAICIEQRQKDWRSTAMVEKLHHVPTGQALACERAFLSALEGSCRMPIAGYAESDGSRLEFSGLVLSPDGTVVHEAGGAGDADTASEIGRRAGLRIREVADSGFFDSWQ